MFHHILPNYYIITVSLIDIPVAPLWSKCQKVLHQSIKITEHQQITKRQYRERQVMKMFTQLSWVKHTWATKTHDWSLMLTRLHHMPAFPGSPVHLTASVSPGVFAAAVVPGDGSEAESNGHCGKGDVWRVKGCHHTAPPVCNFFGQHSDGHDQRHFRRRAHEESTCQVTNKQTPTDVQLLNILFYLFLFYLTS